LAHFIAKLLATNIPLGWGVEHCVSIRVYVLEVLERDLAFSKGGRSAVWPEISHIGSPLRPWMLRIMCMLFACEL